jgi:bifunctional enzyme CysN/CysC/sulfate adenylyltransferase subunit 1
MNEIAEVEFETNLPLFFDSYHDCRGTGSLILIDALTNATVGAVMILGPVAGEVSAASEGLSLVLVPGRDDLAVRLRDLLVARGERAVVIDDALIPDDAVVAVVRALELAGVVAVSSRTLDAAVLAEVQRVAKGAVLIDDGPDEEAILQAIAVRS